MKRFPFKCAALIAFSAIAFSAVSQTGPGGVGSSTSVAIWLDAHTMGGADGSKISSFTDYSGNGNNAVQATTLRQPSYSTNSMNGRHSIDFADAHNLTAGASPILNSAPIINYYCIGEVDNPNKLSMPLNLDYGSTSYMGAFAGILTQTGNVKAYGRRNTNALISANFTSPVGLQIYQGTYNRTSGFIRSTSDFTVDNTNNKVLKTNPTHEEIWVGGTQSAGASHYYMNGRIGEIFVFNFSLNSTQQKILENYISAKYGIPATVDMYSFQATHGLGVVGIGRDNVATSHTTSQGNGIVRISNPADLQDGEYLFVGHDDVEVTSINLSTNVPTALPAASSRFTRQWRAEKTAGNLGNITLVFDLDPSINFSADPDNYVLLIDGDADMSGVIDHIKTGTYSAIDETVTFTNVDLQTGDFFTLAGDSPLEIISVQSGDWNQEDTWDCFCIPTCFNEVTIDANHNVTVDDASFVNDLYIETDGKLTCSTENDLSIYGSVEIGGALELSAGKIIMAGSIAQSFDGLGGTHTLHDFEVNNTAGETITLVASEYTLEGSLLMENGDLVIDNSGSGILIVASTGASTSGRIGEIKSSCTITGNVRVDRFLAAGNADYRNLTSPITNGDLSMWDATLPISGQGFPDGCASGVGGCFHSVKQYYQGEYHDVTNPNEPFPVGIGYEVFVGDDLSTWGGGTISVTGTLNPGGNVVVDVLNDWNSLGNPYASPILWPNINRNHVDDYFYIYDASTGGYQWYDGASNTSSIAELSNGLIASGQGFWTYDYGTLTYEQTDKVDQSATFIRGQEDEDKGIYFTFKENNSTYQTTISFEEFYGAEDGFDTIRDVRHLNLRDAKCPNIAIVTEGDLLRKNWINTDIRDKTYDLHSEFLNEGYYTISGSNLDAFNSYSGIYLIDRYTREIIDLKKTDEYVFYSVAEEAARFRVLFSNSLEISEGSTASIDEQINEININQLGSSVEILSNNITSENAEISLVNMLGQREVFASSTSIVNGSNIIALPTNLKGIHILVLNINGKQITKKLVF